MGVGVVWQRDWKEIGIKVYHNKEFLECFKVAGAGKHLLAAIHSGRGMMTYRQVLA